MRDEEAGLGLDEGDDEEEEDFEAWISCCKEDFFFDR